MLTSNIILANKRCAPKNLEAPSLGPWQVVYVTLNTINGVVGMR